MKFNSYIEYIEGQEEFDRQDKDLILRLHKDCSRFLKSIDFGQKCFRGTRKSVKFFKKIVPRKDRKPLDLPINIHNTLDLLFKKKFGWKPRSEGVFCAPNVYISDEYGDSYYFFPIGDFKFIYNEKIDDIYAEIKMRDIIKSDFTPNEDIDVTKELEDILKGYKQDINTGRKALYSQAELMCQCKSYYLVNTDWVTKYFHEVFAITKGSDNPWGNK